jgi:hypothetical protein
VSWTCGLVSLLPFSMPICRCCLLCYDLLCYLRTHTSRTCNSRSNLDRYEPAWRVGQRGEDPTSVDTREDAAYSDSGSSRRGKIVLQRKKASFNTAVCALHLPRFSRPLQRTSPSTIEQAVMAC